jgi:hypothetical protein
MALYSTLASLSQTAASNAADGSVDAPSTIDQQTNLLASFIAQLRDGVGFTGQLGYKNRIINGNFAVNQRVVAGTVTLAAGAYGHDRWKAGAAGCTYTFASSGLDTTITISAGSLQQVIESVNVEGGTYVMSWTGTAQGKIAAGAYSATGVTGSGTAGSNLTVEFNIGTLTKVQLEVGSSVSSFERRPYGLELVLCQRYYEAGSGELQAYNLIGNGTSVRVPFRVQKRAAPTLVYVTGVSTNCAVFDARTPTSDGLTWYATPVATGTLAWLGTWTATAEL